jgi:DNA mismatch repair protein MutS2
MPFVPHPVTHTSSRLLEFQALRDLLAGYTSSPLGQSRIAELVPSLDQTWIETQQQLTTEIRDYRRVGGRFEFAGLPLVKTLVEKSRIAGAALETTEIRDVVLIADLSKLSPLPFRISQASSATSEIKSCPTAHWTTKPRQSSAAFAAK